MYSSLFLFLCASPLIAARFTLAEAEQLALQNNPRVQAAEELVYKATISRWESIAAWLPHLSIISEGYVLSKPLIAYQIFQPTAFSTQLSLMQSLFSSEIYFNIKISSLVIDQSQKLLEAAKNDCLLETRVLYYLVALDHLKIATAKERIRLLSDLVTRMQGKLTIGEAIPYNVNQARVAMANATDAYYEAQQQLKSHSDQLTAILGFDPKEQPFQFDQDKIEITQINDLVEIVKKSEKLFQEQEILQNDFVLRERQMMTRMFPQQEVDKWIAVADQARPDILLSKTYQSIAKEKVKQKYGEYIPKLSLTGGYGGSFSTPYYVYPSSRFTNEQFEWAFGLNLSWTIFDGTGREQRIRKAKAEAHVADFDAKKVIQSAHADVGDQLYRIEKSLAKYLTSSANAQLAEQTLKQLQSQFEIGYVTIYDYLISVDGLITAVFKRDEGLFELLTSYYALLHACGKPYET